MRQLLKRQRGDADVSTLSNAMADDGHRSVRRRSLLSGVDLNTPYAKIMLGCTAVGPAPG